MNTVYTTTITDEARRRGIAVEVIDAQTPIFILKHANRSIRCFNALTDRIGAVTFHMAQDKHLANHFLGGHGIKVPRQHKYLAREPARDFMAEVGCVVVKPCREWGGRGVSVAVRTVPELDRAIRRARVFSEDIIIEEFVRGIDYRIIIVDSEFIAAIERRPATVTGNGRDSIRTLINQANARMRKIDPSCRIPLDAETTRNLKFFQLNYNTIPAAGRCIQVRLTTNYHTGGQVFDVTKTVPRTLVNVARRVAKLIEVPVLGVDFLAGRSGKSYRVVELSPDLAISPPEGARVASRFLDFLFPETKFKERVNG